MDSILLGTSCRFIIPENCLFGAGILIVFCYHCPSFEIQKISQVPSQCPCSLVWIGLLGAWDGFSGSQEPGLQIQKHKSNPIQTTKCGFPEALGSHSNCNGSPCEGLRELGTVSLLGPPVVPFYPVLGEGSPTKIDYKKRVPLF